MNQTHHNPVCPLAVNNCIMIFICTMNVRKFIPCLFWKCSSLVHVTMCELNSSRYTKKKEGRKERTCRGFILHKIHKHPQTKAYTLIVRMFSHAHYSDPFLTFQLLEVHSLDSSVNQSHLSLVCSTVRISIIAVFRLVVLEV